MIRSVFSWITLLGLLGGHANGQTVQNKKFDRRLRLLLNESVPTQTVQELRADPPDVVLVDAREPNEYAVSHLKGAVLVGYEHLDLKALDRVAKDQPIRVYCSVGYRSQKVTRMLLKQGFTDVKNVYGGIFEWVNRGYPVVDQAGPTDRVHGYSPAWGQWIQRGQTVYNP